jgi:predicted RNA-binding protein (virulence factor B family)
MNEDKIFQALELKEFEYNSAYFQALHYDTLAKRSLEQGEMSKYLIYLDISNRAIAILKQYEELP